MSKRQGLLFIGVFTIALALSGLPPVWKQGFTILIGLGLIIIAYYMPRTGGRDIAPKKTSSAFVESDVNNGAH